MKYLKPLFFTLLFFSFSSLAYSQTYAIITNNSSVDQIVTLDMTSGFSFVSPLLTQGSSSFFLIDSTPSEIGLMVSDEVLGGVMIGNYDCFPPTPLPVNFTTQIPSGLTQVVVVGGVSSFGANHYFIDIN